VVDGGRIAGRSSPRELLARQGFYYRTNVAQFKGKAG
jgi:ABC-type multidrug transport system fused ATPase/permease subunit